MDGFKYEPGLVQILRQSYSSKLRYLDMNVANGGTARDTVITNATWVDTYNYSGSGLICAWTMNLEISTDWEVRFLVDSEELFDTNGIALNDIIGDALYDADSSGKSIPELNTMSGLYLGPHDTFQWVGPLATPVRFNTNVTLKVKRRATTATKKFKAGLMIIVKET